MKFGLVLPFTTFFALISAAPTPNPEREGVVDLEARGQEGSLSSELGGDTNAAFVKRSENVCGTEGVAQILNSYWVDNRQPIHRCKNIKTGFYYWAVGGSLGKAGWHMGPNGADFHRDVAFICKNDGKCIGQYWNKIGY